MLILPAAKTAPITTAPKRSIGVLGAQTHNSCGRRVNQRLSRAQPLIRAGPVRSVSYKVLRAGHGFIAPRRTPVTVGADSGTAMRAPVLAILLVCLGLAGVGLARRLLIPLARAVQARCGYSTSS
jgi:hypothetical protein